MLEINGREVGLFYSVWARCEWNDWLVANGETKSIYTGKIQQAVIMSKAYCDANGTSNPLTRKEIMNLPGYVVDELIKAVEEQVAIDCRRTVEEEPAEGTEKNAESSAG